MQAKCLSHYLVVFSLFDNVIGVVVLVQIRIHTSRTDGSHAHTL